MRFCVSKWIGAGVVGLAQAAVISACQFARPADVDPDAADIDVAPLECTPSTTTCTNDRYTECDLTGHYIRYQVPNGAGIGMPTTLVMNDYECPLGCGDATRCANPVAAHGVASLVPTWSAPLADVDLTTSGGAAITIDTDTTRAEIEIADAAGHTFRVPVEVVGQSGGPEILVLEVRSLTIRADARIVARGARALAIASALDIVIAGRLDASGFRDAAGGITSGPCVGVSGTLASGGGGNWDPGGASSAIDAGGMAQPTGQPLLVGGCSGGPLESMDGGYAGGAIQLTSRTRISLENGAIISVAGGGGRAFPVAANLATGGGAGGAVYLEAPLVQVSSSARVVGRGGSGSAAKTGQITVIAQGIAGDADLTAASVPEVTCAGCGVGGAGGLPDQPPMRGVETGTGWGGGGGSVGRAVIATRTGTVSPPSGTMMIKYALATLARN